jgi:hypothetical protein
MTQRTSMVGGIISFTAVIFLTSLTEDRVEGGGLLQRMVLPGCEDSIDALENPDSLASGGTAAFPSGSDQAQGLAGLPTDLGPFLSIQSDDLDCPVSVACTPSCRCTLGVIKSDDVDNEGAHPLKGFDAP